jgi:hypothetical protein
MAHSSHNTVQLTMGPSNRIMMVMVKVEKTLNKIYLVHCEVHDKLGDIFFCTSFGGFDIEELYNLRVWHRGDSVSHSMDKAQPIHLRYMKEYLKKNFLLRAKATTGDSFEVDFTLTACLPTKVQSSHWEFKLQREIFQMANNLIF